MTASGTSAPLLRLDGVAKAFPGVQALDDVELNVYAGEVMALLGENGAGKSTLMKVLTGVYQPDQGVLRFGEQNAFFRSPAASQAGGLAIIHQELNLLPELTIAENIFLGREPVNALGRISTNRLNTAAAQLLGRLGVKHDPKTPVRKLGIGDRQMVEIAKALSVDARVIVMDEPTDALTEPETQALFRVIRELRTAGCGLVYISHRLAEVFQICDRVTVLRDGRWINEWPVAEVTEADLIHAMVGRTLEDQYPFVPGALGKEALSVESLSGEGFAQISFAVQEGEVLGLAGLIGAGRTEVMRALAGAVPAQAGRIRIAGQPVKLTSPAEGLRQGIAYISEDRKSEGLVPSMSVRHNMTLSSLTALSRGVQIRHAAEARRVTHYINTFRIKTPAQTQEINFLSGGNQQKVIIAKGLMTEPRVLILDEPTRGVDVGAKKEIYELINALKASGMAILLVSSDMPEILGICDRILVMSEGRLRTELSRSEATQERVMAQALVTDNQEDST